MNGDGDDMTGSRPQSRPPLAGLLAAALRERFRDDDSTGDAERKAIDAFLAARDSGAHKVTRTRRRDDWR